MRVVVLLFIIVAGIIPCLPMLPFIVLCMIFGPMSLFSGELEIQTLDGDYVSAISCVIVGYGGFCGLLVFIKMAYKCTVRASLSQGDVVKLWLGRIAVVTGMLESFDNYVMFHTLNSIPFVTSFLAEAYFKRYIPNNEEIV